MLVLLLCEPIHELSSESQKQPLEMFHSDTRQPGPFDGNVTPARCDTDSENPAVKPMTRMMTTMSAFRTSIWVCAYFFVTLSHTFRSGSRGCGPGSAAARSGSREDRLHKTVEGMQPMLGYVRVEVQGATTTSCSRNTNVARSWFE